MLMLLLLPVPRLVLARVVATVFVIMLVLLDWCVDGVGGRV